VFGRFCEAASADLVHAGGYLVLGAAVAATIQVVVPAQLLDTLGGHALLSVASMALLAVLLSVCSEADAFVAAGLPHFSLRARLVFLVVGPMVDLKLIAMQRGVLGAAVTWRFDPMVFAAATLSAVLVGTVVL
jgi:uncharacterized membrane protein YraQ (UPF0718 family)